MAWIADCHLAAAVSNAGGAGIIATGGRDGQWTREQIRRARGLTAKPFGINLGLASSDPRDVQDLIAVICEEKPAFVTVGAGNPIPFIDRFHKAGIQVIGIIPNLRLAKRVEAAGIDMIVLEGTEAGGRIGHLSTMAHLTNVIPEVRLPVLAAGAIADGRGLAAALIMGAEGIQMGTRFLVSEECVVHPQYKEEIINATDEQSVTTGLSRNLGMRGLRSPFTVRYHQMEISGVSDEELNRFATGASQAVAERGLGVDGMNGMVQCGQGIVPIKEIKPVQQIIDEIVSEAVKLLKSAPALVK
jgi:enoyl-[acyl-carrier protein] reductase II